VTTKPLTPAGLRCAHKVNPLGVAPDRVRLSWVLEGSGTGRAQRAYQVLVTPDDCRPDSGDDLCWDSGRIESSASADIAYAGLPLAAGGRYRWKVRVWDEAGLVSGWSEPGWFEVELDRTDGWHASWIGLGRFRGNVTPPAQAGPPDPVAKALNPAPYLRRAFTVDQPVAAARLYVTALGLYEARLNGRRVGDAVLAPGWTDYARRIPYLTYDVTGLLAEGDNVLGAILADGCYSGFDASGWRPVRVRDRDATPLVADPGPPVRVTQELAPRSIATAYWAYDAALMAEIADATGRADEAAGYRALWSKIRSAFAEAFVAADGQIALGTQTAYVLSLHMNLIPDDLRAVAADRLAAAIRSAGWHLTTGFVGVGYILPVLSAHGHADVAYRLLEQDSPPSWRYMVEAGATTIWERWDGWTVERGFSPPG
jgi:hypothetical protein